MTHFKLFVSALLVSALAATSAAAQSFEIRFRNQSGMTLLRLFASDTNNQSWEQDLLGTRVLNSGQYFDLTVHNVSNCYYDLLMEFENGQTLQDVVDLCNVGTYTIN